MRQPSYAIHVSPSVSWFLVFDSEIGEWFVEERKDGEERSRWPLTEFEASCEDERLGAGIQGARERAVKNE